MEFFLRSLLLSLLALSPVGAGQMSLCEAGSLLHLNPHHHDDALNPHAVCTDTGETHHDEEPAPCSDDCSLIVFDTPPIHSISHTPVSAPKARMAHNDWTDLHAAPSRQHLFTASKGPPDCRRLSCSPEQICQFLN